MGNCSFAGRPRKRGARCEVLIQGLVGSWVMHDFDTPVQPGGWPKWFASWLAMVEQPICHPPMTRLGGSRLVSRWVPGPNCFAHIKRTQTETPQAIAIALGQLPLMFER